MTIKDKKYQETTKLIILIIQIIIIKLINTTHHLIITKILIFIYNKILIPPLRIKELLINNIFNRQINILPVDINIKNIIIKIYVKDNILQLATQHLIPIIPLIKA